MDIYDKAHAEHGKYFCRSRNCISKGVITGACERYSMGIYAGMYCEDCWALDGRNHDRNFDPMDAGEHYSEEDY